MKVTFISNYINHHQIPFCNAMYRELQGAFCFIQTMEMEEERVKMGWLEERPVYVKCSYEEPQLCRQLIAESEAVLFGGCEEEAWLTDRLKTGKPVMRYHERLYKTGQWKMITPRGLIRKYKDHTRYRNKQVYLLCAGAYVPIDFALIHAYPRKMFRWGYFPETKHYKEDELMTWKENHVLSILWAGRFLDWKHPELAVLCAEYLKSKGYDFHMDIIGSGDREEHVKSMIRSSQLEDRVTLLGYRTPGEVRTYMERANIFLVTSDRQEGWGAVVNEAMNSGCGVVVNHHIGAAPFLIQHGKNGLIYRDHHPEDLFAQTEKLVNDRELCKNLGLEAYHTIVGEWNGEQATGRLLALMKQLGMLRDNDVTVQQSLAPLTSTDYPVPPPCSPAPVVAERKMYRYLIGSKNRFL
jgi:glycosyltransferase involved in cell wall biosynthesis